MDDAPVVCVTGAANGIGRAASASLARDGWRVACLDVDAAAARAVVGDIVASGGAAEAFVGDVTDADGVAVIARSIREHFRRPVTCLVNNAAIFPIESPLRAEVPMVRRMLEVNVLGQYVCTQVLLDQLATGWPGRVVCVSSGIADAATVDDPLAREMPFYAATKAALDRWLLGVAGGLRDRRIAANVLYPGALVATPGLEARGGGRISDAGASTLGFLDADRLGDIVAWLCRQPLTLAGQRLRATEFGTTWGLANG